MYQYQFTKEQHEEEPEEFDLKSKHGCTDPLICVLFVVAVAVFGGLFQWCVAHGNVAKLYHGIDYAGRICGLDEGVQDSPYLYWCASTSAGDQGLTINTGSPICVQSCPGVGGSVPFTDIHMECAVVSRGLQEIFGYSTIVFLNKYCIPDVSSSKAAKQFSEQLTSFSATVEQALTTLPSAWPVLCAAFLFAILMGYAFLVMLRHCAAPLIWLAIAVSVFGSLGLGIFLWTNADRIMEVVPKSIETQLEDIQQLQGQQASVARAVAVACWVFAALLVVLAQCLHHSIHVAAACAEVACETIFEMPSLLLAPVAKVAVKGAVFFTLLLGFLLLCSTCEMTVGKDGMMRHFRPDEKQKYALAYYVFMTIWILGFVSALYHFMVAYAVAQYYYTPFGQNGAKAVGFCALCDGLHVGLLYHAGSLALGSLLIAVLFVLERLLEFAEQKNRETINNRVVQVLLGCVACLVGCCKDVIQRVNRSAYIDMAITSNSFCEAAQQALSVMARIAASMGILTGATVIFAVFGVALIGLSSGIFAYTVALRGEFASQAATYHIESPATVGAVAVLLGGMVGAAFMDIFDVTSDTLLYCYGLDSQSGAGGHTAPRELQELFSGG